MKKKPNSNSKDRISGDASDDEDILDFNLFDNDQTSDFSDLEEDILQLSKDSDPLSGDTGQLGASEDDVIDLFEEDNAIDDDDLIDLTKEFEEFLFEDGAESEKDADRNSISFPVEDLDDSATVMDLLELTDEVDILSTDAKDAAMLEGASGNMDDDDGLTGWDNEISFSLDDNELDDSEEGLPELDDEAVKPLEDEEEPLELTDEVEGPTEDQEEPLELADEVEGPTEDQEEPLELADEVEGPLQDQKELPELTGELDAHADETGGELTEPADDVALPEEKDAETPLEHAVIAEGIVLDTEIVESDTSSEETEVASTTPEIEGIDLPFEQEDDSLFPAGEIGEDLEELIEQANEGMDIPGEPEESAWDEEVVDEDEVIDLTEVAEVLIRQGLETGSFADGADDLKMRESNASAGYQASPDDIVERLEDELPAAFIPVGTVEKEDGVVRKVGEAVEGLTVADSAVEKALENVIREMFAEKIERILVNAVKKVVEEDIERLKKQILDNIDNEPGK